MCIYCDNGLLSLLYVSFYLFDFIQDSTDILVLRKQENW